MIMVELLKQVLRTITLIGLGNTLKTTIKYTNMTAIKKQETQIFYEWCYSKFEVRTKLELKGRGITKSEYNNDIYFVTPKALEKLEAKYTCARYDVHSLND